MDPSLPVFDHDQGLPDFCHFMGFHFSRELYGIYDNNKSIPEI